MSSATAPETPAADRAYHHVKTGLLDGSFPDGELLSEGEVAGALQMSRTPVREAFLRLQSEGFLKLYPKRGALVVPVSADEARAVIEARLALESFAIDKLAIDGTEAMAAVGRELAAHPACDGADLTDAEMHVADRGFHATLVSAAGNPVVTDLYNTLRDKQMRITSTARTHSARERITRQHSQLAETLSDGDAEQAKKQLREHLLGTVHALGIAGGSYLNPTVA
ncbi:GntR family transcriptional regulator [Saccharopolyspora rhizosphaerae]|uniref:GntR family transcriptional regulator n=1 Tax=Saccharopolyspora rhizosphaerae TaxID=2492662 RepID=A0A3R8PAP6_9PSEU|nr:GntR family transcriptional regulator [Saccharopolyspora rhizosphaerae]RRO20494.1 GntR family transcriptional regulator [Saccharopolyspora rhizosphaerae]